ncbi:hypothetical protein ACFY7C_11975 [Streptomyces sp. NPDC012769]|uniref:hypothetical protein n=1 Tax=Streptomyces sp. NPDC012769 TaxID=3364848 RepID=UPI0036A6865D
MTAEISLPVHVRVGAGPELQLGTITLGAAGHTVHSHELRTELAAFHRAVADALDHPPQDDQEVNDAAA